MTSEVASILGTALGDLSLPFSGFMSCVCVDGTTGLQSCVARLLKQHFFVSTASGVGSSRCDVLRISITVAWGVVCL